MVWLSARVFDGSQHGPEFDHLVLPIKLAERMISGVGFGDSFLEPFWFDTAEEYGQQGKAYRLIGLESEKILQR